MTEGYKDLMTRSYEAEKFKKSACTFVVDRDQLLMTGLIAGIGLVPRSAQYQRCKALTAREG